MFATLKDYLTALEGAGELHRIKTTVSPILEITEIADRISKQNCPHVSNDARLYDPDHCKLGGKGLFFENVEGCDFPLAINAFGSYRRMEMALGCDGKGGFEAIAAKIASLTKPSLPGSIGEVIKLARQFMPLLRITPKRARNGICQQVVKLTSRNEVDLTRLPLIKCWPLDGDPEKVGYNLSAKQAGTEKGDGRYITFAGMHTIHADDRGKEKPQSHNIGMYRAQLADETHLVMHWHIHHDGAAHWRSWKKIGKPMPIAICFGGESVLPYAATCPLPPGVSELLMAGFLNGRGIPMVKAKTVPLRVPANSEIVIEGFVSTECGNVDYDPRTGEELGPGAAFEGPFGDHTGFYSLPDRYPFVDVTAITHREDAVFPATIVGIPPQEDYYIGKATERIFLPLLQTLIPDIKDYHLPMFGCFHNCAFVKIKKAYALQARRVMHAIWGAGQMAWTKMIVVVDANVDVHDENSVWREVFKNCNFARDLEMVNGPLDILDHASPYLGTGNKLGIDATTKIPGEDVNGISHKEIVSESKPTDGNQWGSEKVAFPEFGLGRCAFISVKKVNAGDGVNAIEEFFSRIADSPVDFIIAVNEEVDINKPDEVLLHFSAVCDPGRDLIVLRDESPADKRFGSRIGFDATVKLPGESRKGLQVRDYPPIIKMNKETIEKVDKKWQEYGFAW